MAVKKTTVTTKQKSTKNLKSAAKPPSPKKSAKKSGRKSKGKATTARTRKIAPGTAGLKLRNAISLAVADQSQVIADALVVGSIQGNIGSTRLLVDLTDARNPKVGEVKKRNVLSLADFFKQDTEYEGPDYVYEEPLDHDPAHPNPPQPEVSVLFGGREPQLKSA